MNHQHHRLRCLALAAALLAGSSLAAAGAVDVSFVDASRYTDAGTTPWDERRNLDALAQHIERLGQRHLGAGQRLQIEVLDVDLAGWTRPSPRTGGELRLVRGGADFPRIAMRYSLAVDGKVVRSGRASVADMNYGRGFVGAGFSDPLHHEKTMLDRWFRENFTGPQAGRD